MILFCCASELGPPRGFKRYRSYIILLLLLLNPFKSKSRNATEPLVNIASAVKATDSITDDLRTAEKKGNAAAAAFVSFVEKRLKSNEIDYLYGCHSV